MATIISGIGSLIGIFIGVIVVIAVDIRNAMIRRRLNKEADERQRQRKEQEARRREQKALHEERMALLQAEHDAMRYDRYHYRDAAERRRQRRE